MAVLAPKRSSISLPVWVKEDRYWRGALHILSVMSEREAKFRTLSQRFVNLDESTIDFFAIKRAVSSWSHGEKIMVNLAAHLFNETHEFKLSNLDYLDGRNLKVALKAIESRYMR